ncbi:hypothetical protein A5687_01200 [Mycobacterium mantenii]|nr:hypothetical protein A5687_01200 [Mycobacterium mantenii]
MIRGPLGNRAAPILFRPRAGWRRPAAPGFAALAIAACRMAAAAAPGFAALAIAAAGSYAQFSPANLAECCVRP